MFYDGLPPMPDNTPVPDNAEEIRLTHDLEVIAERLGSYVMWLRVSAVGVLLVALLLLLDLVTR